ncbi:MAG: glycosyltransferase family 2 protein [Selenomonadales bacterium]|nr:glycosyltransferase family 2 protein [Selenomonadales bacterium]
MKLIIQIPCFNEADALPITLKALPRQVAGFDRVEWLVIDDGSSDGTAEVAAKHGVDHIIRHTRNRGLARAFMTGLDGCLSLNANFIVNVDADNQYNADDIPALLAPLVEGKADIVVGARPIEAIKHFSPVKKYLQKLGSSVVRLVSGTSVPDAPSGFRAMSQFAARRLAVFSDFSYTLETIIQAGQNGMAVVSVPVRVNENLRPSRLFKSNLEYIWRSVVTIVRIFVVYRPFRFFASTGAVLFACGTAIGLRFLWLFFSGRGDGHIQSLTLAGALLGMGFQAILIAFIADLLSVNRKLLEELRFTHRESLHHPIISKDLKNSHLGS